MELVEDHIKQFGLKHSYMKAAMLASAEVVFETASEGHGTLQKFDAPLT